MPSGWITTADLGERDGGTTCLTLGCSDDFHAVRLGFANTTPTPWRITRAIGRASSTFNDYINPTGDAGWIPFTFAGDGRDTDEIASVSSSSAGIMVAGNGSSANGEPAWTWTDWTPISSIAPDPMTGMRVIMLRALIPSSQTVCFANGQLRSFTANPPLNRGFNTFIGGIKFDHDKVTNVEGLADPADTWRNNQLANGSLFPIVQFLGNRRGIVGMTTGDSHHQGTSTTDQMTNYLYRVITELGSRWVGRLPFGMATCAVGGLTSDRFFPRLSLLLPAVSPSYVVMPGWTYNDIGEQGHADWRAVGAFVTRLVQASKECLDHGALPIFLTPMPRTDVLTSATLLGPWLELRKGMLKLRDAGAVVVDASTILSRMSGGLPDGTYLPEYTDDGIHPNDNGHQAIANALATVLTDRLGES
jgi:hypothetical protein